MDIKRGFVWHVVFIFCSLIVSAVVVWALPLGDPEPGTLPRAILVAIFFTCYTTLLTLYWYRKTYQPDQTEDIA
jgi:hypothetical protein